MREELVSKSREFYKALFDEAPYEIHVWEIVFDADSTIKTWRLVDANPKALASWNKTLTEVIGKTTEEIFTESNPVTLFLPLIKTIFETQTPNEWEQYFPDTDQILHMTSTPVGKFFISCGFDISEFREMERELERKSHQLEQSLQRLQIATEAALIGVWDYDLASNTVVWDSSMYQIYGVEPSHSEIPYETWLNGLHNFDKERATNELNKAIETGEDFTSEFRIVKKDSGEIRYIAAQARVLKDSDAKPSRIIGVNIDRTDRKQAENHIEKLAFFDMLTGLPNRTMIDDRLSIAVANSGRTGLYGALFFIDLDSFKTVNDSAGHFIGDELLAAVSNRLGEIIRNDDTFGRFGGDEFIVILNNLSKEEYHAATAAKSFAMKLLERIRSPFELSSGTYITTASIGICLFIGNKHSTTDILRHADLAMYKAKGSGRNTAHFFDPVMQQAILERAWIQNDLKFAIEKNQLELHYQPKINIEGEVTGAEALLRWLHPERGYISPALFIPVAEESGQINEIGNWVLTTAFQELKNKISVYVDDAFTIAINLSSVQLYDIDLIEIVSAAIIGSGINPRQIILELTETALAGASMDIAAKMQKLKSLGLHFSLDDFGTGYSSLTRLKQLPIDELKIDQSFVSDISMNADSSAIARSVIALADSMSIRVIAEGVETETQKQVLEQMGCRNFQGYLFSHPLDLQSFIDLLKQKSLSKE